MQPEILLTKLLQPQPALQRKLLQPLAAFPGWINVQPCGLRDSSELDLVVTLQVSKIGKVIEKEAQEEEQKMQVWQDYWTTGPMVMFGPKTLKSNE